MNLPETLNVVLASLHCNPNNPRQIKGEKFESLVNSVLVAPKFLFIDPIKVDRTGMVIDGNMRTKALQYIATMSLDQIVERLEGLKTWKGKTKEKAEAIVRFWSDWLGEPVVPVTDADDLDEDERREYIVKANTSAGFFDWDVLGNLFSDDPLAEWGVDAWDPNIMAPVGDLAAPGSSETGEPVDDKPTNDKEAKEDDLGCLTIVPRCNPGDIWKLGDHRLICGDSTDDATIARLMAGDLANLVFTDPPYGMGKQADGVNNDNLYGNKLLEFNKKWVPLSFKYMEAVGSWYCWGLEEPLMRLYCFILLPMIERHEIVFRNEIVWDKGPAMGQNSDLMVSYARATERCLFVMKGVQGFNNNSDFFYEPFSEILDYLVVERDKCGWSSNDVVKMLGKTTATHYFTKSQFSFPTREAYNIMQRQAAGKAFALEYDILRKSYDEKEKSLKDGRAFFDNTHDIMRDVWEYGTNGFGDIRTQYLNEAKLCGGHATPKPQFICSRGIKSSSREGEIVLDLFGGSGSTLIACEQLARRCRMIEMDPYYCDVILARWEKLTCKKAERVER